MIRMSRNLGDIDPNLPVSGATCFPCSLCFQSCTWAELVQRNGRRTQKIRTQMQSLLVVVGNSIPTSTAPIISSTRMKTYVRYQNLAPIKKNLSRKREASSTAHGWWYAILTTPFGPSQWQHIKPMNMIRSPECILNNFLDHTKKCIWWSLYQKNGAMTFEKHYISA